VEEMRKERLYEALKKVLEIDPDNIRVGVLEWKITVLSHIRDLWYEREIEEVIDAIEDWAEWRKKKVEKGLPGMLWDIKKETWRLMAERRGVDYISTAVVRDFANETAGITSDENLEKIAEIYSLLALALKKNPERTVDLLIKFMDHYYGDVDALIYGLKNILDTKEENQKDRKELLLRLCEELTKAVEYFYHEDDAGLKAHLGEVLGRYASLLSNIGWAITWASEDVQDKVFEVIEDGFWRHEEHRLKCRLEEWLSWKVGEVVETALEDKEEEKETQQTQAQPTEGELPF
jgi:hypothetical protein